MWRQRYGDVFSVPLMVFGMGVYIADPEEIGKLFTGDQSELRAGEANAPLAPLLGDRSVLILDGREHLRQRKLLLPPFGGKAVGRYREVIREVAEREVGSWRPGERVVLRSRMRALTFEVIVRVVFGVTERGRIERLRAALVTLIDSQTAFLMPEQLHRELGGLSPWARFQRRKRAADALIYEEIERRREVDLSEREDVLSLLLGARDEDGNPMTDVELRDELMTLLLAGHETTATGLAFAFDLLYREPAVLGRLRDELAAGTDDSYLDAVVSETLRLRPVIDACERTLSRPREIGGWQLPAGIRVYPGIALVHHRPDLYPQPHAFRPERFLDEGAVSYSWLPFGGGIRRCIGAALAQAEMAEVIRTVVGRVELEPEGARREPVVVRGITLVPRRGAPATVRSIRRHRATQPPVPAQLGASGGLSP